MSLLSTIIVGSDHVLISSLGMQYTITNVGAPSVGSPNLYYAMDYNVSPTRNDGVLVPGQDVVLTEPQVYVIADSRTTVTVEYEPISTGGGGGGSTPTTVTSVADLDYQADAGDAVIAYTALTAPRFVTPPVNPAINQSFTIVDQTGKGDRFPIMVIGNVNSGTAGVLKEAFGQMTYTWDGSSWTTTGWAATTRPAVNTGTNYYVANEGSDLNDGKDPATAWQTVDHARRAALNPGDGLFFKGGQTFSDVYFNPGYVTPWIATSTQPIVVGSFGNGQAIISKGVFFAGSQATQIIFDNLEFHCDVSGGSFQAGSSGNVATNVTVQRCTITQPDFLSNDSPAVVTLGTNMQFIGNYIHHTGSHGMQPQLATTNHQIYRNLIYAIGQNSSLSVNQHHMYLNCAASVVSDNVCVSTPSQVGFPNASSAISCRFHDTTVSGNHVACTNSGTDFYSGDTVEGTTRYLSNRLMGIGTATGGYGVFITEDAQPLIENTIVTQNTIDMAGTGNTINIHTGTGTIEKWGNIVSNQGLGGGSGGGGGGGGGGGPQGALAVTNLPFGSFVLVDLSTVPTWGSGVTYAANDTVWGSNGTGYKSLAGSNVGHDPTTDGGVHWAVASLTIDGNALSTLYSSSTPPTASAPMQAYAVPWGSRTFVFGGMASVVLTVIFNTGPWSGQADVYGNTASPTSGNNITFWGGAVAGIASATAPNPANSFGLGYGWLNSWYLRNGYAVNTDSAPATSAVFVVAPGDEPYQVPGGSTKDTRSQLNLGDNYGQSQTWRPSSSVTGWTNGVDPLASSRAALMAVRYDFQFLASFTAPTLIQNSTNAGWLADLHSRTLKGWPADFAGATASAVIAPSTAQWKANMTQLSNLMENQGPAVFIWAAGDSNGTLGGFKFIYQPTAAGISQKVLTFDTVALSSVGLVPTTTDSKRISTVVEYQNGMYATANGAPWLLGAQPTWSGTLPAQLTLQSGGATWSSATSYAKGKVVVGSDSNYYASLVNSNLNNNPVSDGQVHWSLCPLAPYGVPRDASGNVATPGGGWFRVWRDTTGTGAFQCVTQNLTDAGSNPLSIPGTATWDPVAKTITESATNAGKVYGATWKSNMAQIATGGISIGATSVPLSQIIAATNFVLNSLGRATIIDPVNGNEDIAFTGFNSGTSTLTGVTGVTKVHPAGCFVIGLIEPLTLTPGINEGQAVASPMAARSWPLLIGPTMASVATPAASLP